MMDKHDEAVEKIMQWLGKYTVLAHKTDGEEHIYSVCGIVDVNKLREVLVNQGDGK
jgi:hypothetical protein